MKAVFDVSLVAPQACVAISNTVPMSEEENDDDTRTVRFAPTPKMSTYFRFRAASSSASSGPIEKKSNDGVLVRVFTTPGKTHQAQFALECATKVITFFNKYFDIPYPMPVLDLIAIPILLPAWKIGALSPDRETAPFASIQNTLPR